MSKFHFDENIAAKLSKDFDAVLQNIANGQWGLSIVKNSLWNCQGFDIENILKTLDAEMEAISGCISGLKESKTILSEVCGIVQSYSALEMSFEDKILAYVDSRTTTLNNKFHSEMSKYQGMTSEYVNKYCNGFTVVASIKDAFLATFTDGGYDKKLLKQTIKDIINSTSNDFEISNPLSKPVKVADGFYSLLNLTEGTNNEFILSKANGKINIAVDTVNVLANDYANNLEYLNSIERTLLGSGFDDKDVRSVMADIRADYDNKYVAAAKDFLINVGTDKAEDLIGKTTIGRTVLGVLDVATLSDIDSDSKMAFAVISTYENEMIRSYEALGNKIASGNYTQQDLLDFQNAFSVCRQLEIQMYTYASDFTTGQDYIDCQKALKYYTNLSMR